MSDRGARHPDADRDQHQLGAVRGRLDRAGPHRAGRGDGRRGCAGRDRDASRPATTAAATAVTDGAAARRLPGVQPARAGLRRHPAWRPDAATGAISSETVWNDGAGHGATGGGVSDTFPLPSWQAVAGVPAARPAGTRPRAACPTWPATPTRRPATRCWWTGSDGGRRHQRGGPAVGGAGLPAGPVHGQAVRPAPAAAVRGRRRQAGAAGFHDITSGNNGAYSAGPGWDACTGLGSPTAPPCSPYSAPPSAQPPHDTQLVIMTYY